MRVTTAEIKQGDCQEVLRDFPDNSINLIVTSPPYADRRKHTYGGMSPEKYVEWYLKKCGQSFWSFISGDDSLYVTIIEPLGHRAKERNEQFQREYAKVINRFTKEFIDGFCDASGEIAWEKLVSFNSSTPSMAEVAV